MSFATVGFWLFYLSACTFVLWLVFRATRKGWRFLRWIAVLACFLIPTWDVILGYPVFWYLCHFKAGVKIYRTVDNVEGIYVGENDYVLLRETIIPRPDGNRGRYSDSGRYSRYRYVDMRSRKDKRYYRLYPVDNHEDPNCMDAKGYEASDYAAYYNSGRCIAKKEIPEDQVSRWGYYYEVNNPNLPHFVKFGYVLSFEKWIMFQVVDRKSNSIMAEGVNYWWDKGWLDGLLTSIPVGSPRGVECRLGITPQICYKILRPYGGTND